MTATQYGQAPRQPVRAWTTGRVVAVVAGSILLLSAIGMVVGGAGALIWAGTQRSDGYVTSPTVGLHTSGYAITSEQIKLNGLSSNWDRLLGRVRLRASEDEAARPIFIGIGPSAAVQGYLGTVAGSTVHGIGDHHATYHQQAGSAPEQLPSNMRFWAAAVEGGGTQQLVWKARSGDWTVVIMRADGASPVAVHADAGATVPALPWVAGAVLVLGLLLGVLAVVLIALPVHRAGRDLRAAERAAGP